MSRLYLAKKKSQTDYIAASGGVVIENYLDIFFLCLIAYISILMVMKQYFIPQEIVQILYTILILLIILIIGLIVIILIGKYYLRLSKFTSHSAYQFIEKGYNSLNLLIKSLLSNPKILSLSSLLTLIVLLIESSLIFIVGQTMDIQGSYSVFC